MTCTLRDMKNRVQQHPCTAAEIDRNWDFTKQQFDVLQENLGLLNACIGTGGGTSLSRFELTAALSLGGSAAAKLKEWSGGAWVDASGGAIVVKDVNQAPGFWQGAIGYAGWCVPEAGSTTNYHIVWMEHKARWIKYQLREDLITNNAEADVLDYCDGINPGSIVDVYDPQELYKYWHQNDCYGIAHWNNRNSRYEIVAPQLIAMFLHADLATNTCVGDTSDADIENVGALKQGYYAKIPDPVPTVAKNPRKHVGLAGKAALLMGYRDDVDQKINYEVVDLEKKAVTVLTAVAMEGCELRQDTVLIYVETCEETGADTVFTFTEITVPTTFTKEYTADTHCRVVADTRKICIIDNGAGVDATVIDFTSQTVLTDVYTTYDASDDGNPSTTPSCKIYGTERKIWVGCVQDASPTELIDLYIQDVIVDFTKTSNSTDCIINAETIKACLIVPLVADAPIPGADIEVVAGVKETVIQDVYLDGTDLMGTESDVWVLCSSSPTEVVLEAGEECSADAVIDEGT